MKDMKCAEVNRKLVRGLKKFSKDYKRFGCKIYKLPKVKGAK